jgi:hypothetical protein
MNAVSAAVNWLQHRVALQAKPVAEPEPVYAERRPVTGLLGSLSAAQLTRIKAYDGPENHGNAAFMIKSQG